MGTSISQGSPRNFNWNRVFACYSQAKIPKDRIIKEIWGAATNEQDPITAHIKTELVYSLFKTVKKSNQPNEAMHNAVEKITEKRENSIAVEFAKRSIPIAFQSKEREKQWGGTFFAELTKYFISRDLSGFVGERYRNKTVRDMIEYKNDIGKRVEEIVVNNYKEPTSFSDWRLFVDKCIKELKK